MKRVADAKEVPIEVLPPLDPTVPVAIPEPLAKKAATFYHPASGAVILGIDLLAFGSEMVSGFLDTPAACVLAFVATFAAVYLIQTRWAGNRSGSALGKAFFGAFLAGLPFSIAGGLFGALVMALSGLPHPKTLVKDAVIRRVLRRK